MGVASHGGKCEGATNAADSCAAADRGRKRLASGGRSLVSSRRWSWLSSSSCKLRGAMVVEVWQLSRYHTPRLAWLLYGHEENRHGGSGARRGDEGQANRLVLQQTNS